MILKKIEKIQNMGGITFKKKKKKPKGPN